MIQNFRPMLATPVDWKKLRYPVAVFPKVDGCRAVALDEAILSRTLKPFPNRYLQEMIGGFDLDLFDGEICVGPPNAKDVYQQTYSGIMSKDGEPSFKFHVFDLIDAERTLPYSQRRELLLERVDKLDRHFLQFVEVLPMQLCHNQDEILAAEDELLSQGYEGCITRDMSTVYKFGRATANSQELGKIKRFVDSEARITGFECMYSNQNEATVDERGYTKRSSHKENKVPLDTLGTLFGVDIHDGCEVEMGTGFTAEQRKSIWDNQDNMIGKIAKYKHFPHGAVDKKRHPVFLGFRSELDL